MPDIAGERLLLHPIDSEVARALLEGRTPDGLVLADDYPSPFSLEVMDLIAGSRAGEVQQFESFFIVRRSDAAVIGEIGSSSDAPGSAQVGYSLVPSCWGRGYATEALRALLGDLATRADVRRVVAETMVGHEASRRVMEKAGMVQCGRRRGEEAGESVELVVYELVRG